MIKKKIRIATRKSPLAIWQANHVATTLKKAHPDLKIELIKIVTKGDILFNSPLSRINSNNNSKGLFVKELEKSILQGYADIAVHSVKDIPNTFPEGLELSVILKREDPRDVFISDNFSSINDLPSGARVGTASLRRQCQLIALRPDLKILPLRGNINTRLTKLDNGYYDAIILAGAGLIRLGLNNYIKAFINSEEIMPAVGQGAIGIETRIHDLDILKLLTSLHHEETAICIAAERAMSKQLGGGCQAPIASYSIINNNDTITIKGLVSELNGKYIIRSQLSGPITKGSVTLGKTLANQLLTNGASKILKLHYE